MLSGGGLGGVDIGRGEPWGEFGDWLLGMGCCQQHMCVLGRAGECGGSGMHALLLAAAGAYCC